MNGNWLTQLAPAHAPAAAGWWPPAPGWWVIAGLLVLIVATLVWKLRDPRRALRHAALRQLRVIRASDADGAAVARATQNLIRRYALEVFGRDQVSRLTGEAWLKFVIDRGGGALAGAPGRSMLAAAFGNTNADDRVQWFAAAEGFVKRAEKGKRAASVEPAARTARAPARWLARVLSDFATRASSAPEAQAPGTRGTLRTSDDSAAHARGAPGTQSSVTRGTLRTSGDSAAHAPAASAEQSSDTKGPLRAGGGS